MWFVAKAILLAVGAIVSLFLILLVWKSKRRLDRRVAEFKAEIEENNSLPPDPYAALAELYTEDERKQ